MTCSSCEAKVTVLIKAIPDVINATADKNEALVEIESTRVISLNEIRQVLPEKYSANELQSTSTVSEADYRSWLEIYRPILLIFFYITIVSIIIAFRSDGEKWHAGMNAFMAGFFLVFSFFKLLNLSGFASSYAMYDIVAKKWNAWGYIYAFIELGLGVSYCLNCCPFVTNIVTLLVMSISIIGVMQSVLNKKKIQCACLGAIFDLPMSTVTIIEDVLMILMSGLMLLFNI